jgi:hypothetical protein
MPIPASQRRALTRPTAADLIVRPKMKPAISLLSAVFAVAGCATPREYEAARNYYTSHQAEVVSASGDAAVPMRGGNEGRLYVLALIGEAEALLMVDSGSTTTIIDETLLRAQGIKVMAAQKELCMAEEVPRGPVWRESP